MKKKDRIWGIVHYYILTKTENFDKAKQTLTAQGYTIV